MNTSPTLVHFMKPSVFSLVLVVLLCGCGKPSSSSHMRITERTTTDGTTICELEVRDKSLKEVLLALSDKLDKPIRLGPNVDPERNIQNIRIETNDWLGVLNGFAGGMGHLSVTADDEEIRLNSE